MKNTYVREAGDKREDSPSRFPSSPSLSSHHPGYIYLLTVLLTGAITMAATISLLLLSWANEQNGVTFWQSAQALQAARSCADQGLKQMQDLPTYNGSGSLTIGPSRCRVLRTQGAGAFNRSLCSIGVSGAVTRRIRVDIDSMYPYVQTSGYEEVQNIAGCGGFAAWEDQFMSGSGSVSSGTGSSASSQSSTSSVAATANTLLAFNISNSGSISFMGSVSTNNVYGVAATGTAALLATDALGQELVLADVLDPSAPVIRDVLAGPATALSVAIGKGKVLLGSQKSSAAGTGKFRLWRMDELGIAPSPGPWTYTTSGSAVRIAADPTGCYAFIGTNWGTKALQVVKIKNEAMTEVSTYALTPVSTIGNVTGLWHDPAKDRVYIVTDKRFYALSPLSSTPSCP